MSLLQKLSELPPESMIDGSRVAVVVAHPDDESIGCGALLSRLENASIITVTDGAPRNGVDAVRAGFNSPAAYRKARSAELRAALAIAGVGEEKIMELGISDQEVCRSLVAITRRLVAVFEAQRFTTVLTHAFEGGHPDHDGTAFCIWAAATLLRDHAPALVEMPFYHLAAEGMVTQVYCDGEDEIVAVLPAAQRHVKKEMMKAHGTQAQTLQAFGDEVERFRTAREHDFRTLPNNGQIQYSQFDCGLLPQEWSPIAIEALSELGIGGPA